MEVDVDYILDFVALVAQDYQDNCHDKNIPVSIYLPYSTRPTAVQQEKARRRVYREEFRRRVPNELSLSTSITREIWMRFRRS